MDNSDQDSNVILLEILKNGEFQLGEKERIHKSESLQKDVALLISERTIDPSTKRPYTTTMIEKVLSDLHFNPNPNKNSKQLALEGIKLIQESKTIPIERVRISLRVSMPSGNAKKCKETLLGLCYSVESEEWGADLELTATVEPGNFKTLSDLVSKESRGKGIVEVLTTTSIKDD